MYRSACIRWLKRNVNSQFWLFLLFFYLDCSKFIIITDKNICIFVLLSIISAKFSKSCLHEWQRVVYGVPSVPFWRCVGAQRLPIPKKHLFQTISTLVSPADECHRKDLKSLSLKSKKNKIWKFMTCKAKHHQGNVGVLLTLLQTSDGRSQGDLLSPQTRCNRWHSW